MLRIISCLIFILTNSVMAQAEFQPLNNGTIHIGTQKWITTYAGETEVDGLPVIANLDETQLGFGIEDAQAGKNETQVPSLLPVVKRSYRLNLIISNNPRITAFYVVRPGRISLDGVLRNAFVSDANDARGFQFIVTKEIDGTAHVTYTRKVTDGSLQNGEFSLSTVPHIL